MLVIRCNPIINHQFKIVNLLTYFLFYNIFITGVSKIIHYSLFIIHYLIKMLEGKEKFIFRDTEKTYIIKIEEPKKGFFSRFRSNQVDSEIIKKQEIEEKPPCEGCRAFITDLVVGDQYVENHISEVYRIDAYSDYVGAGKYPDCKTAFPNAAEGTFDGLAVDKGTRIIIYSKPDFKGKKFLDIVGSAIINNKHWKKDKRYNTYMKKKFVEPYQSMFPKRVRKWSKTNMHSWTTGSIIVICDK